MCPKKRVHVIACGVLAIDLRTAARDCGLEISEDYLPGGLHEHPDELRRRLQEAIDKASDPARYDLVAVGYGLCGRGSAGIHARGVPLAFPRVHDCISLFLGSDAEYKRQFAQYPGTYYISAGWHEEKVEPKSQDRKGEQGARPELDLATLAEKYGEENAREIIAFHDSWKRNYQRAAFIDTGTPGREKYAAYSQAMAEEFGWKYEALPGDLSLLKKVLTAQQTTDDVLVVPPGYVTVYDPREGGLAALPPREQAREDEEPEKAAAVAAEAPKEEARRTHYGLGIDAGGTYTDAVIYDFHERTVIDKAKALTTKWDFTIGIAGALDQIDPALLKRVGLVSVSTTLATNAIVEGHGQKVGLLVFPPYGKFVDSDIAHHPKAVLSGKLDITGEELAPIDEDEVRRVCQELAAKSDIGAFAVSGFASTVNPKHELEVKRIAREATGLSVTCGHELSGMLDFRTRALTAVLNARIIPRLERFLRETGLALERRGIDAPIMVVKGDGSLMSAETARERPVETAYSGPAASVAGARYLTGEKAATVVDMGGTTTDTAMLKDGAVTVCEDGSQIGQWHTHVRALDMRTIGLGGDSLLTLEKRELSVGPARVAPVAWAGASSEGTPQALDYLERHLDDFAASTKGMDILTIPGAGSGVAPTEQESAILSVLRKRPHSVAELAAKTGVGHWRLLRLERLEEHHLVQRCGLTPTDLLHVSGGFRRWDVEAARRLCDLFARLAGHDADFFIEVVMERIVRQLAIEVLKKQLDEAVHPDLLGDCDACNALLENAFSGGSDRFAVTIKLGHPIIGIGAPVHYFLPRSAQLLGAEVVFPPHADVANAVGAITSNVVIQRTVHIRPDDLGRYAVEGLTGAPHFAKLVEAHGFAVKELTRIVREAAGRAGTSETRVDLHTHDRLSTDANGTEVFIERVLAGHLSGRPD